MALRHLAARTATSLNLRWSLPLVRSMSTVLDNLRYARSHEWVRVEGDVAFIGITDHAQTELGDVVHVEVKAGIDEPVTKGTPFAVVESVKAASDVYAPVSGTVLEINGTLDGSKNPELVNKSPFEEGWFAKVKLTDPAELDSLLQAKAYEDHVAATAH